MRRLDNTPVDPELAAWLEAIDATLAGEAVSPRYAESAELALLLAAERPLPREPFAAELDARVERRFAPLPSSTDRPAKTRSWRPRGPVVAGLLSLCLIATVAVAFVVPAQQSRAPGGTANVAVPSVGEPKSAPSSSAGSARAALAPRPSAHGSAGAALGSLATRSSASGAARTQAPSLSGSASGAQSLQLPPNGRKVIRSSQIDLGTTPDRIDAVAHEVFAAVGAANGIVDRSTVTQTGGLDGYASLALRLPSSSVAQALNRLSELPAAQVLSRTDASQDVNARYVSATRALAEAQALRTALLKQLAHATTSAEIEGLKAQVRDVDASIAAGQAAVNRLNAQVNYTQVTVTITARTTPAPAHHSGGGFTLGHASHIAGRVLIVAAGIALIALAALVPIALLAGLLAWIAAAVRRRRREQALDTA